MISVISNCSFSQSNKYTDKEKYWIPEIYIGFFSEGGSYYSYAQTYFDVESREYITVDAPVRFITMMQGGFEAKKRIKTFTDKASISVAAPLGFRLDSEIQTGTALVPSLTTGLFADANFFKGSTYNNISKNGFSVGAGVRVIKPFDVKDLDSPFIFMSPTVRIGFMKSRNLRNNANIAFGLDIGIPWRVEGVGADGTRPLANNNFGINLRIGLWK